MHLSIVLLLLGSRFNESISAACSFFNSLSIDSLHYLFFFWELSKEFVMFPCAVNLKCFLLTKNPAQLDAALSALNPWILGSLKKHVV